MNSNLIEFSIPNISNSFKSLKTIFSMKRIEENFSENNESSLSFDYLLEVSSERSQSERNDIIEESAINFSNFICLMNQTQINFINLEDNMKDAKIEMKNIPNLIELERQYNEFLIK
jgi:hypothetical protein